MVRCCVGKCLGFSVLIVGGTVLVLSVAWQPLRRIVLGFFRRTRNLVPPAIRMIIRAQPVAENII